MGSTSSATVFFFFKQKAAYEMRISDWSSDVCSSDLRHTLPAGEGRAVAVAAGLRRPGIALAERRHADDAGDRTARLQHCHQHAEEGRARDEGLGAVDRVDHPEEIPLQALAAILLAKNPVVRIARGDGLTQVRLGLAVGNRDRLFVRLPPARQPGTTGSAEGS